MFSQYLSQRNMSEDQFVEEIRQEFALQNLMNLVQNGTLVSDAQAAQPVNLMQSERTIRSFTFSPQAFAAQAETHRCRAQKLLRCASGKLHHFRSR